MALTSGKLYSVKKLPSAHPHYSGVAGALKRRGRRRLTAVKMGELYSVKWKKKPFRESWTREVRPKIRWFYHGTTLATINLILDGGFKIAAAAHGRMLGNGIYAAYHVTKGMAYGKDGYVVSVMVYAPNLLVVHSGQQLTSAMIASAKGTYQAIEVRTGAVINGWTMRNHEICVFAPQHVIPRFIAKLS